MFQTLQEFGVAAWFLLLGGGVTAFIFFDRLFHLHRAQIKSEDFLSGIFNVVRRGNIVEAVTIAEDTPGPVALLTREALLHHDEPASVLRGRVVEAGNTEIARMERSLPMLATLAKLMPAVGLLGTVTGMMSAFSIIQQKAPLVHLGDLSGAMYQALSSTALGLVLAILAFSCHNILVGRVASIVQDMERAAQEITTFLAARAARSHHAPLGHHEPHPSKNRA